MANTAKAVSRTEPAVSEPVTAKGREMLGLAPLRTCGDPIPACPNCGKSDRVERCTPELAAVRGGQFFCPCNEPGPAFFDLPAERKPIPVTFPTVGICGICAQPIHLVIDEHCSRDIEWVHANGKASDGHGAVLACKPVYDPASASAEMSSPGKVTPTGERRPSIPRKYTRASGESVESVQQPFVAGHDAGIPPISVEEAYELQDILRTLTNSGRALITSARELVKSRESLLRDVDRLSERSSNFSNELDRAREEIARLRGGADAHRYWAFFDIIQQLRGWARGCSATDEKPMPQELHSMAFVHMHALANWLEMQVTKPLPQTVSDLNPLPPSDDGGVIAEYRPPVGDDDYDHSIHTNPDAKAWADFFMATVAGRNLVEYVNVEMMHGWFANAMMAMHDFMEGKRQREAAEPNLDAEAAHRRKFPFRTFFLCGRLIVARCNQAAGAPVVDRGQTRTDSGETFDGFVIRNPLAVSSDPEGDVYPGGPAISIGWRRNP